ncbi:Lead, cadmium, zinc and mercury transporting ATPase [Desulfosporosinus metallidurans]|uniref:Lead, cadmium, zinc and mercury transporting ATPase n=1 Tax=Desulfosporosinus metallidurans TaxID=1888891 RepID=A0A1Q8QAN3_9FIRM|nr:Lead, cadmium, zinc and mercury transporting ATPase [Desulfosporosinus metallidurans]
MSHVGKNSSWEIIEYLVNLTAYFIVGYKVLAKAVRNLFRGQLFDENFF